MTAQEAQMLQDLVRKVEGTTLTEKDADADAVLKDGLGRDPDAIYKLAQTVLVQNIALEQARAQMERMQQQFAPRPQPPARATSFLGGLLHHSATPGAPALPPQYQAVPPSYGAPGYAPTPGYAPPPSYGSPGGGFLRSAATTAAGVAGGMLAFEGIESLMHGGMGGYGIGGAMPVDETVVNNYYEEPQGRVGMQGQDNGTQYNDNGDVGSADVGSDQGYGDDQNFDDQSFDDGMGSDFGGDDSSLV